MLGLLWSVFGLTSLILGTTWAHMKPSWRQLGPPWGILAPNWAILKRFWSQLSPYWSHLGPPPATFGPTKGQPRANFVQLGPTWFSWGHFGIIFNEFWSNFGAFRYVELSHRSFHAMCWLLRLPYADPDFWHVDFYLAVTEINNAIGCEAAAWIYMQVGTYKSTSWCKKCRPSVVADLVLHAFFRQSATVCRSKNWRAAVLPSQRAFNQLLFS